MSIENLYESKNGYDELDLKILQEFLFALLAERLNGYYKFQSVPNERRVIDAGSVWLSRQNKVMSFALKKTLSQLSKVMCEQIINTSSREAGLYIAHEMHQGLDPNQRSEVAESMLDSCAEALKNLNSE